jgi:hypothetical protein
MMSWWHVAINLASTTITCLVQCRIDTGTAPEFISSSFYSLGRLHLQRLHLVSSSFSRQRVRFPSTCIQFSVKLTLEWIRLESNSPSTPPPLFVVVLPPARTLPLYVHPIQCQIDTRVDSTQNLLTGPLRLTFKASTLFRRRSPASAYASSLRASDSVSN